METTYLKLRERPFFDEIADAVVSSPLINSIQVLDPSMGALSFAEERKLRGCLKSRTYGKKALSV